MDEAAGRVSSAIALPLPRMVGRRMVLKLAARGGMGDVYLGATTGLEGAERPCIVKTVRRDHVHDGSFLARFLDEARVQAQLQHPGVAQVLEAANDESGEPYTVVEYVEGRALSDVRQRALQTGVRVSWADAVAIAIEIAQALAHVHERSGADGAPLGIVHRDLSPQNVMVGYAGEIKLIDFGTARGHNRRCHTVAGVVFAKPGYVAPEVARQQAGDGRIDVYALGIVLWELCTGRRFLTGDPQQHLDDAAAGKIKVPPIAIECHAPRELDEVISQLTQNDPDERYSRASVAALDLGRLLSLAPATQPGERGVRTRICLLMRRLWPHEPGRSRAEFARLLREGREALGPDPRAGATPSAGPVSEGIALQMAPDDPKRLPGTPYRLERTIGDGAGGTVYEAKHIELGRKVALKVMGADASGSSGSLNRFRSEARAVASLSHPNLVQLYDFGRSLDGRVYFAMELCEGETLDARLRRGPIGWKLATRIAVELAKALEAAHAAKLVHRDVKPHNVMLLETRDGGASKVKLLDFGVASAATRGLPPESRARLARGFVVLGTPEYMAPEQVADDPVDGRADIYALGCVLYEMLTGERAFDGPSSVVVMGKQLRETPRPPKACQPSRAIPSALDAIVVRSMAKNPDRRFQSAAEIRTALESVLSAPGRAARSWRTIATATLPCGALLAACFLYLQDKPAPAAVSTAACPIQPIHAVRNDNPSSQDSEAHPAVSERPGSADGRSQARMGSLPPQDRPLSHAAVAATARPSKTALAQAAR
jgi:eukaryotic-like serine/threonine-protein kinase